ncbi:FAD-dependent oxidoreductase [Dactylosporangium roseum]|uniref:FAD-dependent oxidoreductase n=1 Tax=Dactylosporangium roseum TaxID=47989 RepID=A0ABY5Z1D5_9ACTN|nr:FAD-dependent oxidoreductase [Dactylosporangium roseum]UWZ34304.1 FAD-dependent oxidoreductase [Dactylosporangium roseum]
MTTYDAVIVGAGPAGMSAARTVAEAGLRVALVDAAPRLGGQYHRQPPATFHVTRPEAVHHGWRQFAALRDRLAGLDGVTHLPDHHVWSVERTDGLVTVRAVTDLRTPVGVTIRGRALLVATGGYDRQLPFPGWDLPGVVTAGAAQALLKANLVLAGQRVVVAGSGPFLLPVAAGLGRAGATVAGVYEAARTSRFLRHTPTLARNAGKIVEAVRYHTSLLRHRIPVRGGWAVVAAHGDARLAAVTVMRLDRAGRPVPGTRRRVTCDTLAIGYGFSPQIELLVQLGCATRLDVDGSVVADVDAEQCTDVPSVYAAGEVTGIGGAALSHIEGTIAGLAIRAAAGRPSTIPERLLSRRAALRRFAAAMHDVYRIPAGWTDWLTPTTIVCRCEEVPAGRVRAAVEQDGATQLRTAKLLTRAGMGWCQGRVCGHAVSALVSRHGGRPATHADLAAWASRPIAQPVPLRLLADAATDPSVSQP